MTKQQRLEKIANLVELWFKWILVSMIAFNVTSVVLFGTYYEEGWFAMLVVTVFATVSMASMHVIDWLLNQ